MAMCNTCATFLVYCSYSKERALKTICKITIPLGRIIQTTYYIHSPNHATTVCVCSNLLRVQHRSGPWSISQAHGGFLLFMIYDLILRATRVSRRRWLLFPTIPPLIVRPRSGDLGFYGNHRYGYYESLIDNARYRASFERYISGKKLFAA